MDAAHALRNSRIVPVVSIDDPTTAVPLAETLLEAGFRVVEVTLRTPRALGSMAKLPSASRPKSLGMRPETTPQW